MLKSNNLENIKEYINDNKKYYNLNNKKLFLFLVIFIFIIAYISKLNISITLIFSILIAYYFFNQLRLSEKNHNDKNIKILNKKINKIRPSPEIITKYEDLINFLFSIQDLYEYNPAAYEEMIDSIKSFLLIYEESKKINILAHQNYSVANIKKNNAVNSLHSIIINSVSNNNLDNKINRSYRILNNLLEKYIDEIELLIKKDIKYNGYNVKTNGILDYKMKPYNDFESNKYMFELNL